MPMGDRSGAPSALCGQCRSLRPSIQSCIGGKAAAVFLQRGGSQSHVDCAEARLLGAQVEAARAAAASAGPMSNHHGGRDDSE